MSTLPPAHQRIQAQQRAMAGKDLKCDHCGSEHLYEVQATRYLSGGTGSVEIQADSNEQVFPLLKCAGCNYPVLPKPAVGRRHGGVYETSHKLFRESIEKGQAYLKSLQPTNIKQEIVGASADDLNEVRGRLSKLEKDLGEVPAATEPVSTNQGQTKQEVKGKK